MNSRFLMPVYLIVLCGLFCIFPESILACDYPIYPVRADLKVNRDAGEIRVSLRSNVVYWREQVLGNACTRPGKWPEKVIDDARKYLGLCFGVSIDGKRLEGTLESYRYTEIPFAGYRGSNLHFVLTYPLPGAGRELEVYSRFFSEYHEHVESGTCHKHDHSQSPFHREFTTHLRVSGGRHGLIEIPLHDGENGGRRTFSLEELYVTSGEKSAEAFVRGLGYITVEPAFLILLLLAVFSFFTGGGVSRRELSAVSAAAAAALFAGFAAGIYIPGLLSAPGTVRAAGFAVLAAVCAASYPGKKSTGLFFRVMALLSSAVFGAVSARYFRETGLPSERLNIHGVIFAAGWLLSSAVSSAAIYAVLNADMKMMKKRSESMAGRIFGQHRHFAVAVAAIITVYLFFRQLSAVLG